MADDQGLDSPKSIEPADWSSDELFNLLQCLKKFGSRDIANIAKMIPTKTTEQITETLQNFREKAISDGEAAEPPVKKSRKTKARSKRDQPSVPLSGWAKLLQDSFSFKQLHTVTADCLRMIAECEDIPPARETCNIDFRKVYRSLADAMEGKPLPDDIRVASILEKCMLETAINSKAFNQSFFETMDLSGTPTKVLPNPTDSLMVTTLKDLISQKAYNPFNIPFQYLRPMSEGSDSCVLTASMDTD